jgi:peptidoglycan/LPS O-acetylase OafA/YrhL
VSVGAVRRERVEALDGIRGIAILSVVLFHCSLRMEGPWRVAGSWGWMGVDLFFVLSGFLITGILLDARDLPSGTYYRGFYGRRLLRIAPAFVAFMVLLVAAPGLTGQTGEAHLILTRHEAWYWAFLANALIAAYGWAAVIPQTAPLWSLAVEEQFYLIWPSVIRRLSTRGVLRLGLGLIVLAALSRILLARDGVDVNTLYVLMPTRADVLAWGAVLAALVRLPNGVALVRRLLWPALLMAVAVVIVVMVRYRSSYYWSVAMVTAGYPAIAVLAACLVAMAVIYDPAALRFPWLSGIGKVSYGLYLWHMTGIEVLARFVRHVGAWFFPLALVTSLIPTLISWYLIERPAFSLKRFVPMRATEMPPAVALIAPPADVVDPPRTPE